MARRKPLAGPTNATPQPEPGPAEPASPPTETEATLERAGETGPRFRARLRVVCGAAAGLAALWAGYLTVKWIEFRRVSSSQPADADASIAAHQVLPLMAKWAPYLAWFAVAALAFLAWWWPWGEKALPADPDPPHEPPE